MLIKRKHMAKPISVEFLCNYCVYITQLISMYAANPAKINMVISVISLSKMLPL